MAAVGVPPEAGLLETKSVDLLGMFATGLPLAVVRTSTKPSERVLATLRLPPARRVRVPARPSGRTSETALPLLVVIDRLIGVSVADDAALPTVMSPLARISTPGRTSTMPALPPAPRAATT
jgi:hypothetical protein